MNKYVWFNQYLPQTLQIAVAIAYFRAVFDIIFSLGRLSMFEWVVTIFMVVGAFGIANLKYWGYYCGIFASILPFLYIFWAANFNVFVTFRALIGPFLIFTVIQIAIVALLVHPMSRNFVKENFTRSIR